MIFFKQPDLIFLFFVFHILVIAELRRGSSGNYQPSPGFYSRYAQRCRGFLFSCEKEILLFAFLCLLSFLEKKVG